ncbi:MAG: PorT family protein, partial [Proteobacteria bacterium]
EPQLRFNQKGGSLGSGTNNDIVLSYLDIPLYAKYKFVNSSGLVPFVFAGPSIGIKVGAKVAGVSGSAVSDLFKTIDFTADLGVGGEYAINESMNVSLSGAYSLGFVDVTDGALSTQLNGATLKNRGFNLYAGLSWVY